MHILTFLFLIGWLWVTVQNSLNRRRKLTEFHRAIREENEAEWAKYRRAETLVTLWRERARELSHAGVLAATFEKTLNDAWAKDTAVGLMYEHEQNWHLHSPVKNWDGAGLVDLKALGFGIRP
ncbi:MAG: hypothetical protein WA384_16520 [Rhodomicrobium sp.]